ncbi:MAG TPA: hypothetical protein VF791_12985 [Pyrinomonadaceae bacterium]
MEQQITTQDVDRLLVAFLCAKDESESERLLGELICEQVEPTIIKIIKSKLRVSLSSAQGSERNQDALELAGDLRLTVLSELRRLKSSSNPRLITNLQDYVAVKTFSACADYFREKNPRRWRLKSSLRHHLRHNPRFALWESEGHRWLCGLSDWRESENAPTTLTERLRQLSENPEDALRNSSPDRDVRLLPPVDLLTAVFEHAGHAIELDDLVTIAARVWGIRDQSLESVDDENGHLRGSLVDKSVRVDAALEQRLYLEKLWAEVCDLPPLQRAALLLNLRDAGGGSVISFIPYLKIASKAEMAEVLSMSEEQFAKIWNDLPLDDRSIGELLGITRQQVINLRKTARERLARRMKTKERNA